MYGNIQPAMHLPFLRGLFEMLARLTTWEHMQRRMKESKPYLLNLVDLGEKGKEKNKETKASVNKSTALQCSTAHFKGEEKSSIYTEYTAKHENKKTYTSKPCS